MPIAINIVVGITLYAGLLFAGFEAIDAIIANVPTWTTSLPHWADRLPDWQFTWPTWLTAWTTALPHWTLAWPHWTFTWPDGLPHLPAWRPTLPDWVAFLPNWAALILIGLLRLVLTLLLLLITGFVFLQFGVLLGAPWYGKLSEELEQLQTGKVTLIEVSPVKDVGRAVAYELKKLVISVPTAVALLLLNFFPGIGTIAASIIGLFLATTLVCMDFLDAAVERRRPRFRDKLGLVWRSLPASASFGLICLGLVSVPLINLLAVPVCVAAGTLFFCDRILPWFPSIAPSSND